MTDHHESLNTNVEERTWWLDRKENVTKVAWALYLVCAVVILLDFPISRKPDTGFDGTFGFYGAFGFLGSFFLVLTAKQLRKLLKRPEGYYDD